MGDRENDVLLFDGICNLCNRFVQFLITRDTKRKFKFASLQSEAGQQMLNRFKLDQKKFNSFVLIKEDQYFIKSTAALIVLKELGGGWKLFYAFILLPRPIRDAVYNLVSKSRYRVFGKRATCMIPTPEQADRFL